MLGSHLEVSPLWVSSLSITAVGLRLCLLAISWLRLVSASRGSIKSLLYSSLHGPSLLRPFRRCPIPSGLIWGQTQTRKLPFYWLAISWSGTSIHWQNLFCHTPHFHFGSDSLAWSCSHLKGRHLQIVCVRRVEIQGPLWNFPTRNFVNAGKIFNLYLLFPHL